MKVKIKCKHCNKEFEKESWQKKIYCNRQCGANDKKKTIELKKCKKCGKEFKPLSYEKNRKYCSRECANSISSKKGKINLISKICEHCKKEYKIHPYRKESKYCSHKCKYDAGNIITECKECGSIIKKQRWLYESGITEQYCEKCRDKYSPKCSMLELDIYNELKKIYNIERHALIRLEKRKIYPDIKIGNFIIECMGNYWHCNPEMFDGNYLNLKMNKTAKEIWDEDEQRKVILENNGYKVFYVWEKDWCKNKNSVLKQIEYEISKN